jgi:hypothetical protein
VGGDWREWFRGGASREGWTHPDSPNGGTGPGFSRPPMGCGDWSASRVPHPDSPAGRHFDWFSLSRIDTDDRALCVLDAVSLARQRAPRAILEATGHELGAIVDGIIPGLLICLAVLTATSLLGTVAGAAIGALAFGVGAAPGAAIGATAGLHAGLVLLEWLGLAFLAGYIASSVAQAAVVAAEGVEIAWRAMDRPRDRSLEISRAADCLATALGLVFRGVLQGIVAFLLAKGTAVAAGRVSELIAHLRTSRLGARFAFWVEGNWRALIENPRFSAEPAAGAPHGASRTAAPAPSSPTDAPSAPRQLAETVPSSPFAASTGQLPQRPMRVSPPAPKRDTYVMNAEGVPLGARKGLAAPGLPRQTLTEPGWPDLPAAEAPNFDSAQAVTLSPGTKIYRIIDPDSRAAGSYWAEKLPINREVWRHDYAVKNDWNTNGWFVEYTVPQGSGLRVWKGKTAGQDLKGSDYHLPGGADQIWMPPQTVVPSPPKPTRW